MICLMRDPRLHIIRVNCSSARGLYYLKYQHDGDLPSCGFGSVASGSAGFWTGVALSVEPRLVSTELN